MRYHYRTGPRTAVSTGCITSTITSFVILAGFALLAAAGLTILAVGAAIIIGGLAFWIIPTSLYEAFNEEWGDTAGWAAVAVWVGLCVAALGAGAVAWAA